MNNPKISSFFVFANVFVLILTMQFALMGCGPDDKRVWMAIPCKLNIIDCSSDSPNTIDLRLLNDDGSINERVQFEQNIIEENERILRYKKDIF